MKTTTTISEITKADLVDLFSTAVYGSPYLKVEYDESVEWNEDDCHEDIIANILLHGGSVRVCDYYAEGVAYGDLANNVYDDKSVAYTLTLEDIRKGLESAINGTFRNEGTPEYQQMVLDFARKSFNAFWYDEREWDAVTADYLMQIILFGEVIYG